MSNQLTTVVDKLEIISETGEATDISGGFDEFAYYESLFSPHITAYLGIIDTGNVKSKTDTQERPADIVSALPIRGKENLNLVLCHKTGRLLAEALNLKDHEYQVCFQSRFGKAEWLKPYFTDVIAQEAEKKDASIHVICPGFSSDCLETLEEINMEGKSLFLEGGGKSFNYIPALNKEEEWIKSMEEIIRPHLAGWIDPKWTKKKEDSASNKTKKMYNKVKATSK